MASISEILTPESSPLVEEQLVAARRRAPLAPSTRELLIEVALGGAFVVAAVLLAALVGGGELPWLEAAVLVAAAAVASRVVFSVGSTFTSPVQLAFVPMLFLLPAQTVPLLLGVSYGLAAAVEVVRGRRRPAKLINALVDCWFALPAAIVLVIAGSPSAAAVTPGVLIAVVGAGVIGDFVISSFRERMHTGATFREQALEGTWVILLDLLLAPLGFLVALGAEQRPWVIAFPFAIIAMLKLFSREREQRLDSLVELSEAYRGTARVLGDVIEFDDAYTGHHTMGVVGLATKIAARMGLDSRQARIVEFGALLHDVGKIAVPKEIINKPGPLDAAEWDVIKTHTVEGERMLERIGGLMAEVGRVVRSAHERWDGAGYPDGLAGDRIPIESRIIFCCDAFNAMTTDRPYRSARSADEALEELQAHAGTQFDPRVVEHLIALVTADPRLAG